MKDLKIGVLGCGYDCVNDLDARLEPWFDVAHRHELVFSFVSARFSEYKELNITADNVPTVDKMFQYVEEQKVQYVEVPDRPMGEAEARNLALRHLLHNKCDLIWLLDLSDEYYTVQQIENILRFTDINPYSIYFKIPFKNYIFDGKQWIEGFCPPRIFRRETPIFRMDSFYWDNDVFYNDLASMPASKGGNYTGPIEGERPYFVRYISIAGSVVPACVLNEGVKHMTWLHTNGKDKVAYQQKHFGHCSYKWNDATNQLEFDTDFYTKNQIPIPIIRHD